MCIRDSFNQWKSRYGTHVQSIRMISCRGRNVWSRQNKRWSTAAIGEDSRGRILFIHVRSPYPTHDLINMLQALPLDLARAMYLEGGPEAQLFVGINGTEHEFLGGFANAVDEKSNNHIAWPIPNVIGIVKRNRPQAP